MQLAVAVAVASNSAFSIIFDKNNFAARNIQLLRVPLLS